MLIKCKVILFDFPTLYLAGISHHQARRITILKPHECLWYQLSHHYSYTKNCIVRTRRMLKGRQAVCLCFYRYLENFRSAATAYCLLLSRALVNIVVSILCGSHLYSSWFRLFIFLSDRGCQLRCLSCLLCY